MTNTIVSQAEWLTARRAHLEREKELTRLRDAVAAERRALPWLRINKAYLFDSADGPKTLADVFDGRSQLAIYHFMFAPEWEEGCKSCSFWADNFEGIGIHLAHRDVTLAAISRGPLAKLQAYKERMGWTFPWYSSARNDFNFDFQVSFTPEQLAAGEAFYNYATRKNSMSDMVGISVFFKGSDSAVYHTYSCYSRGVDIVNGAYHFLDLTPKGRDEDGLSYNQAWIRRHDQYEEQHLETDETLIAARARTECF